MDNAAFHKTAKTRELIEAIGCHLLYLPTYSPDLNPIEHCWHTIKSWLRPRMQQQFSFLLAKLLQKFIIYFSIYYSSIPAGIDTKVTVTYDAVLPGTADVKVYLQKADGEWQLIDLTAGKPIGESQVERTHVLENFNAHSTKVKLVLSGTVLYRPKVRNLRIVVT